MACRKGPNMTEENANFHGGALPKTGHAEPSEVARETCSKGTTIRVRIEAEKEPRFRFEMVKIMPRSDGVWSAEIKLEKTEHVQTVGSFFEFAYHGMGDNPYGALINDLAEAMTVPRANQLDRMSVEDLLAYETTSTPLRVVDITCSRITIGGSGARALKDFSIEVEVPIAPRLGYPFKIREALRARHLLAAHWETSLRSLMIGRTWRVRGDQRDTYLVDARTAEEAERFIRHLWQDDRPQERLRPFLEGGTMEHAPSKFEVALVKRN